jgi:hypothetical protein
MGAEVEMSLEHKPKQARGTAPASQTKLDVTYAGTEGWIEARAVSSNKRLINSE